MKQFIDKLIERLEEEKKGHLNLYCDGLTKAISIVNQLAEEHKDDIQTIDVSELLGEQEQVKHTNADRIRAMDDEELAEFIDKVNRTCLVYALGGKSKCDAECRMCKIKFGSILEWLQYEAEELHD